MGTGYHGGFGNSHGAKENNAYYVKYVLPKSSPIKIPSTATIKEEQKEILDNGHWKSKK